MLMKVFERDRLHNKEQSVRLWDDLLSDPGV